MRNMSYEELLRQYARRNLKGSTGEIHRRCKRIREEMTRRKPFLDKKVVLAGCKVSEDTLRAFGATQNPDVNDAVEKEVSKRGNDPFVLVLPEAASTQPMLNLEI